MHISYNNFITEVNNLNKRMGDLRDINGEAGTWVRLLNGSGSADGGFTDHYTLLQMGLTVSTNWEVWTCLPA